MNPTIRPAGYAALIIFFAFVMHNINAWYIEPQVLGFEDPQTDYAKIEKLRDAMVSIPWRLSGIGHLLSGFAAIILGFAGHQLFAEVRPVAGRLALGAGVLAGAGFLLTGIANVMGVQTLELLATQNPVHTDSIYLAASIMRTGFNGLAIVALGWFAIELSWCGLKTGRLPGWFCYFGYLAGLSGLIMAFAYIPLYLFMYLIWSLWLAVSLLRISSVGR